MKRRKYPTPLHAAQAESQVLQDACPILKAGIYSPDGTLLRVEEFADPRREFCQFYNEMLNPKGMIAAPLDLNPADLAKLEAAARTTRANRLAALQTGGAA